MKILFKSFVMSFLALSLLTLSACGEVKDGKYAELAKCLTSKGVIFYGSFTCSHCLAQKKSFGDDMRYVTYVECTRGGPGADPEACKKANIQRYPSWFFPGQDISEGAMKPEEIAAKANCPFEGVVTTQETTATTQQ